MTKADVKRLLRKGKLSGKEAALLIIRDSWEDMATGKGFLSESEKAAIRDNIRPGQHEIFNEYIQFNEAALYAVLDAGRLGLRIGLQCGKLYPIISSYGAEARLRKVMSELPQIVTAKEYEERRLAQREYDLLEPVSIGYVLNWYMRDMASEELFQEWDAYTEDPDALINWAFDFALLHTEGPERARPWLERLLEMLRDGLLKPVYYTEEAAERAFSYLESSADYASIYQEQSLRPGARDTAALIEAIESYLAGELEPAKLDDRLWSCYVTGPELYAAGLPKYQEYIESYEPRLPEWPILAILQDENSLESRLLTDPNTGLYKREKVERRQEYISLYNGYYKAYADGEEGGLDGHLIERREFLIKRLEELIAFKLGLQAASKVLGVELTKEPWDEMDMGYESVKHFNGYLTLARLQNELLEADVEPKLPIEPIDISSLKPSERVIELINSRLGKLLPAGWAEEEIEIELGPEPEDEEDAHEPA